MALGAATLGDSKGRTEVFVDSISMAGDSAYPTGGTAAFEAYFQAAVDKGARDVIQVISSDCGGYVPYYDKANDKLIVYYVNNDGGADGPLIQVPNTTDLSAVTFRLTVLSC